MIFKDIECGFYRERQPLQYASTHEEISRVCEELGIVARAAYNMDLGTDRNAVTRATVRGAAFGEYPVYHLRAPAYPQDSFSREEMERCIREERALFRIQPKSDTTPFLSWMYGWTLELLTETRTPLLVKLSETDFRDIGEVKSRFPELRLVFTDVGQAANREIAQAMDAFPHVYASTSTLIGYHMMEVLVEKVGAEHLLFGSNMPRKEPYDQLFYVTYAELSEEEKQLIAYGNFERLVERRDG